MIAGERDLDILTIHVERLYDDSAWVRFRPFLGALDQAGIRATCFVYPPLHPRHRMHPSFGRNGEAKFRDRLAELAARGHEIQQHTHFYHPERKEDLLEPGNVRRAVSAEKEYLEALGYPISGFLSGAFTLNADVVSILAQLGFRYDCSVPDFPRKYRSETLAGVIAEGLLPQGLYELPTTHTLFQNAFATRPAGPRGYRLCYAHDYDFLRPATRLAARMLLLRAGSRSWRTVREYLAWKGPYTAADLPRPVAL